MKILTIGGVDYTFEFSIEASLYNECTEKVTDLMVGIGQAQQTTGENEVEKTDEERNKEAREKVRNMLSSMSNVPAVAMTMFYAGLLEHHGPAGDGTVRSMKDAKTLVRQYLKEHDDDDKGNFYAIMNEMMACMEEDGFFELTGMTQMLKTGEEETEEASKKIPKVPQDHKKKGVNVTKN